MRKKLTLLGLSILSSLTMCAISVDALAAKKTVTVWYAWERPFIRDMIKRYNESHKNVEVKMQISGDFDKFMTASAAGTPPDVICQFDECRL